MFSTTKKRMSPSAIAIEAIITTTDSDINLSGTYYSERYYQPLASSFKTINIVNPMIEKK